MESNRLTSYELEGLGLDGLIGISLGNIAAHVDGSVKEYVETN